MSEADRKEADAERQCFAFTVATCLVLCHCMDLSEDTISCLTAQELKDKIDEFIVAKKQAAQTRSSSNPYADWSDQKNLQVDVDLLIFGIKEFRNVLKNWGWKDINSDRSNLSKKTSPSGNFLTYELPAYGNRQYVIRLKQFAACVNTAHTIIRRKETALVNVTLQQQILVVCVEIVNLSW